MNFPQGQVEDFRVPVRRTHVEVRTDRGSSDGYIFLPPDESPERLLEEDKPFFPVELGGTVRLYARAAVVSLTIESKGDPIIDSMAELGIPCEARSVVVHFRGGGELHGQVTSTGRARTLDLLNQPARTFAVHTDGKLHFVAKRHVERVEEAR